MKLIFLDRDGVINEFPGNGEYVTTLKDFHFIPGSLEAIKRLTEEGYTIFVISNQAGVGKKIFTKKKLDQITKKMLDGVKKAGGKIRKVYYSISRSDSGCLDRKPNVGSIRKAMKLLGKNIRGARKGYFIGDTESDIKAGQNAGCKTIFVLSGREDCIYMRRWDDVEPDYIVKDLMEATRFILGDPNVLLIKKNSDVARRTTNRHRRKIVINLRRRSSDTR